MNVLFRPSLVAIGVLCLVLVSMPAAGQRFLGPEVTEAEVITPELNEKIVMVVDPAMFDLTNPQPDPEAVAAARKQLLQLFQGVNPSDAYRQALSAAIESRMQAAMEHESTLVRINTMIVLGPMVDDGSKKWLDAGLTDKSDAVKNWAMRALGSRLLWWQSQEADDAIDAAVEQITAVISDGPHPVVVGSGFEVLLRVNTPSSRNALITLLNDRVAAHAADPNLQYTPEQGVVEGFSSALVIERPADLASIRGLSRAMARYAALLVDQMDAGEIAQAHQPGAQTMLLLCLNGMASVSVAANAPDAPPSQHAQVRGWIANGQWDELRSLIEEDWATIYAANPFQLDTADLAVEGE